MPQRNPTVKPCTPTEALIIGATARGYNAKEITFKLNLPKTKVYDTLAKFHLTSKLLRQPLKGTQNGHS